MDREELSKFDGKEGRKAYVGFKGKVYDVTESRLWKEGQHVKRHYAGRDLTEDLEKAPHADEVFERFEVIDELVSSKEKEAKDKEQETEDKLREIYRRLHPHPMFIHYPMGLLAFTIMMQAVFLLTGKSSFELAAFYSLVVGTVSILPAAGSGLFSWWVNYNFSTTKVFVYKLSFTGILFVITTCEVLMRFSRPEISYTGDGASIAYNTLVFLNLPVLAVIGYNGGKITWG
ncbi:DUF2231 domain-containing protein [Limisalsivibrio acetivorans]|uniref:DUF2231 domain-containing protein n=1 Tax=Limisalsivibrio acetivorans TaxID=1304888 RepID=UPI0003B3A228|nr:DUF2231 domain-containing protein [Limisalsivibrio acetivorans]